MKPNEKNFCGGAFPDWLEVNLIDKCNAKCSWCVENIGYKPKKKVAFSAIAEKALEYGAKNIILLGGEPTLYKHLKEIINLLSDNDRNVYITTNGSMLTKEFVEKKLYNLYGVNISIHHYDMNKTNEITGLNLNKSQLEQSIKSLTDRNIKVRLNCNCINGYIDSVEEIHKFIEFAKQIGATNVRFAELKMDEENFVDLAKIFEYQYGLNDDPFTLGCINDVVINGMNVNFRQMCGIQTPKRVLPVNPEQVIKKVLYYNGILYNGWQMCDSHDKIKRIIQDVANHKITIEEGLLQII